MCLRRMSSAHLLKIGHQPAQVVPPRLDLAAEAPAIRVSHVIRRGPNARPSLKVIILFISSTVFVKSGPNARPWAPKNGCSTRHGSGPNAVHPDPDASCVMKDTEVSFREFEGPNVESLKAQTLCIPVQTRHHGRRRPCPAARPTAPFPSQQPPWPPPPVLSTPAGPTPQGPGSATTEAAAAPQLLMSGPKNSLTRVEAAAAPAIRQTATHSTRALSDRT